MAIFDHFPEIVLDNIVLRQLSEADVPYYFNYLSDPLVNKFISDNDIPKDLAQAKVELRYWQDLFPTKRSIYWGIAKKNNNQLIGTCGFNLWSILHGRVEISYDLSRKEWNRGIMSKAIRGVCDYAFITMKVKRIQATVATDNAASIRVLEKLGFKQEGVMRSYAALHGIQKDFYLYSLLSSDLLF
jgi:ribosomal-protein-alanine N-acetyltransferase